MSRETMPTCAAVADSFRAEFGADDINNESIRRGLRPDCKPEQRFFASEGGKTIGQRDDIDASRSCTAADWLRSSEMAGCRRAG